MEPDTGYVRSLVGGKDFSKSQFNRATQAYRQPGSAFKPFVYATALEHGFTPYSTFTDEPLHFEWTEKDDSVSVYEPRNFDRLYGAERTQYNARYMAYHEDELTLGHALVKSINTVAVQALNIVGVTSLVRNANRLGMEVSSRSGLCLALGCGEVRLMSLTAAYTPFVNQGDYSPPVFITRIIDHLGREIYQYRPEPKLSVFSEWTAHQMSQMLHHATIHGTGKQANWPGNSHFIGGKTGTTTNSKDAWFIGFSPELVTGVWVGHDDNTPMDGESGGSSPAKIWSQFIKQALVTIPNRELIAPPYQSFATCTVSGALATTRCPNVVYYHYPVDKLPRRSCWLHPGTLLEVTEISDFGERLNDTFSESMLTQDQL